MCFLRNMGNHPVPELATFAENVEKLFLGKAVSKESKVNVAEMKTYFWHCRVKCPFLCAFLLLLKKILQLYLTILPVTEKLANTFS